VYDDHEQRADRRDRSQFRRALLQWDAPPPLRQYQNDAFGIPDPGMLPLLRITPTQSNLDLLSFTTIPPPSTLIVTICFCAFLDAYEGVLPQGLFEFTFDPSGNRPISRSGFHHRTASRNRTISRGIERKFKQALRQNARLRKRLKKAQQKQIVTINVEGDFRVEMRE
jgi:hypothetical protein